MDNDPLDVVFLNPDEAREAHTERTEQRLALYLGNMPRELFVLFEENFQRIDAAELTALRTKAAEYDRIVELIDPNHAQSISIYDQIVNLLHDDSTAAIVAEQTRRIDEARNLLIRSGRVINNLKKPDSVYDLTDDILAWLSATAPAPQEAQP